MKLATWPHPSEHFVNVFSMLSRNLQDYVPIITNTDLFLAFSAPQFYVGCNTADRSMRRPNVSQV